MPNPENYQRAENLRNVVRQEIEDFGLGKIPRLSNFPELSRRFGYASPSASRTILVSSGLLEERQLAKQSRFGFSTPGTEWAWMIGVLAGGGYVGQSGEISVRSDVPQLLDTFKSRGEIIFEIPSRSREQEKKTKMSVVTKGVVAFYSTQIASVVGDLNLDNWPSTVIDKHRWILEHERYSWKFIEGFFEKRGAVYGRTVGRGTKSYMILLTTSSATGANFLAELCVRLGIETPTVRKSYQPRGVTLNRSSDMNLLANNVFPVSPQKESLLVKLRDHLVHKGRDIVYSDQEVIDEWIRLQAILGHAPNSRELRRLKQDGISKYSPVVFARLGEGSHVKAREYFSQFAIQAITSP